MARNSGRSVNARTVRSLPLQSLFAHCGEETPGVWHQATVPGLATLPRGFVPSLDLGCLSGKWGYLFPEAESTSKREVIRGQGQARPSPAIPFIQSGGALYRAAFLHIPSSGGSTGLFSPITALSRWQALLIIRKQQRRSLALPQPAPPPGLLLIPSSVPAGTSTAYHICPSSAGKERFYEPVGPSAHWVSPSPLARESSHPGMLRPPIWGGQPVTPCAWFSVGLSTLPAA